MEHFVVRVNRGESLLALCRRCRLSPERVMRENYLSEEPAAGEVLYVSAPPKRVHVARAGESYALIARRYGIGEETLKKINGCEYVFWGMPVVIEE
ncbi:MAG: hypothetical protein DBX59_09230 [Bacillota bacterium]|nr:MAG: hypothetical protein DBX59_09230 [Bacillota bacterium]